MGFLETLFNYEYFGPILFATIAVLTIIFFVILFFGKKDQKEKILEETRKLELAQLNAFKEENANEVNKLEASKEEDKPEFIKDSSENKIVEEQPEIKEQTEIDNNVVEKVEEGKNPFDTLDTFKEEWKKFESKDEEINNLIEEREESKEIAPILPPIENNNIIETEEDDNELESPLLDPTMEIPLNIESFIANEEQDKNESEFDSDKVLDEKTIDDTIKVKSTNFEELANSISKELEDLENLTKTKEEPKTYVTDSNLNVTPIKEIKKDPNSRDVFSSVFVTKKEEPKNDNETNTILESEDLASKFNALLKDITKEENPKPLPEIEEQKKEEKIDFSKFVAKQDLSSKPKVSLPKKVELPKLDEDNRGFGR